MGRKVLKEVSEEKTAPAIYVLSQDGYVLHVTFGDLPMRLHHLFFIAWVFVLVTFKAHAAPEILDIKNKSGNTVFSMQLYGTNEPASDWQQSDVNFSAGTKEAIRRAGIFWMERLKPTGSTVEPVGISWVQKNEIAQVPGFAGDPLAVAGSSQGAWVPGGGTIYEGAALGTLVYGLTRSDLNKNHGRSAILSSLPIVKSIKDRFSNNNLQTTLMHEMGHILGIIYNTTSKFSKQVTTAADGYKYFTGPTATLIYGDGKSSRPIRMHSTGSHIQLAGAMMTSAQAFSTPMEAELGVMIDMGYSINLRDFYGRSIYTDNNTITNSNGYSKLSASGSYIANQPNENSFGIGLHVFGSNNTVIQKSSILTNGFAQQAFGMGGKIIHLWFLRER